MPTSAQRNYNSTPPGYAISQSLQVTNTAAKPPIFQLSQGPPQYLYPPDSARTAGVQNGQSVTYFPPDAPQAYMQQYHLSLQKQLSAFTLVEASYVGSRGTHLLFPRDLNQVPQTSLGPGNLQLLRPYPQYQSITTVFADANSNYNALQIQVNQRFSNGLTFLASYTYSKSMDTCSLDLTTGGGCEYQIAANPGATYAPSQFDQAQRVVIAGAYELPFGSGRTYLNHGGIANAVIGGWRLSESFTANSGFPFTRVCQHVKPGPERQSLRECGGNTGGIEPGHLAVV